LQIGRNAVEKFGDLFKACVHILLNVRWEVFVEMLDSMTCEQLLTKIDGGLIELTSEGQKCYNLVSNCSNL
jgi:Mn-dependent DtxR family transcriptional regulator